MNILVLAEYDQHGLKKSTCTAINASLKLGNNITVLVVGTNAQKIAETIAKLKGVTKVLVNTAAVYDHGKAESIGKLLATLGKAYTHIVTAATSFGKNILPYAAALLDVAPVSDVIAILAPETFLRPIYAGNAIAKVKSLDAIKMLTVRDSAFDAVTLGETKAPIENIDFVFDNPHSRFVSESLSVLSRPELAGAQIVVSGGRAFQSKEKFNDLLGQLADKLNAAIGASRAAVDAGFADNDYQVGQTGKIVAPDLYFAIGISGAIQHLAGMKDSKVIVAINKDPDCEMMKIADYALKADIFDAVPELIKKL